MPHLMYVVVTGRGVAAVAESDLTEEEARVYAGVAARMPLRCDICGRRPRGAFAVVFDGELEHLLYVTCGKCDPDVKKAAEEVRRRMKRRKPPGTENASA